MPRLAPALLCLLLIACDDTPPQAPPQEPPPPVRQRIPEDASLAAFLGIDAEDLPTDPPAPPGDFKSELAAFTTLDACVAARSRFDPIVGDAVDALGYDTLQRDACRVVQAAAKKDASLCEAILSTSLRQHCQATVAVTVADPLLCPVLGTNHDPLCIALARRDDRLCVSTAPSDRPTCRAVLARDPSSCGGDARCERRVQRWRSFLPEKIERPELGTRASIHVAEHVEGGTLPEQAHDLARAILGATVRHTPTGQQIELGEPSSAAWPPSGMVTSPRLSFRMHASNEAVRQGKHPLPTGAVELEMLAPHRAMLSTETTHGPMQIEVDMIGLDLGDPVRFTLEADVGPAHRKVHLRLVVNTFVRDVVKIGAAPAASDPSAP